MNMDWQETTTVSDKDFPDFPWYLGKEEICLTDRSQTYLSILQSFYRGTEAACLENSTPPLVPPKEEEDWENEIKEVTLTDWEKMAFLPYGKDKNIYSSTALDWY